MDPRWSRRTVHGWFIPVAGDDVVSAIHVLDGGVVAMARCFVPASATDVVGVVDVPMRPAITAAGRTSVGDSGVGGSVGDGGVSTTNTTGGGDRHGFDSTLVGFFKVRLKVGPSLVGCDLIVPKFEGAIKEASGL